MKRMAKWSIYALIGFCLTSTAAPAPTPANKADSPNAPDPRPINSLLYAQVGSRATLKPLANQPHWYRLTLFDVNDSTLWFTNRPVRQTGSISVERFVSRWKDHQIDRFAKDNVNATLVSFFVMNGKREQHSIILRVTHPHYNSEDKTLTYSVRFSTHANPQLLAEQPFYDAALFIDNLTFWG